MESSTNRAKRKTYYMHTLDGRPAQYDERTGICFASFYGRPNKLAHSLKQIRDEQQHSRNLDDARHHGIEWKYGYIRVTP